MNTKLNKILLILLVILIVILLAVAAFGLFYKNKTSGGVSYYAVYTQTGNGSATYYGQIIKEDKETIVLKNPGYINVQPAKEKDGQPQISFNQLKDEFFKPKPEMTIYKQNIVFIQELSADSPIIQAYKNAK